MPSSVDSVNDSRTTTRHVMNEEKIRRMQTKFRRATNTKKGRKKRNGKITQKTNRLDPDAGCRSNFHFPRPQPKMIDSTLIVIFIATNNNRIRSAPGAAQFRRRRKKLLKYSV